MGVKFSIFFLLVLSACVLAEVPTATPISSNMDSSNSAPDEYFRTDILGYPYLYGMTDPSNIILSSGGTQSNLLNNAVVCPGNISLKMSNLQVKWAVNYFNGSSNFPPNYARPFPLPPVPNPQFNAPIYFNTTLQGFLTGMHPINNLVRSNPLYDQTPTTVIENTRYLRFLLPPSGSCDMPNCTASAETRAALVCGGKVIITSPISAQYELNGTDVTIPLGYYANGANLGLTSSVRVDNCVGVINAWPEYNNIEDRKRLFPIYVNAPFPAPSGDANLQLQVRDPVSSGRVVSVSPPPPYAINAGQSIDVQMTIANDQSSVLDLLVTGIVPVQQVGITAAILTPQPIIIKANDQKTIAVRLTQATPPYTGNLDFNVIGQSTTPTCNGSNMTWSIPWTNVPFTPNVSSKFCTITPSSFDIGDGNVSLSVNCSAVIGGVVVPINCSSLSWSTSGLSNINIVPPFTPPVNLPNHPNVTLVVNGLTGASGFVWARGAEYNCSAIVNCGQVNCDLTTSIANLNYTLQPPGSAEFNATCWRNNAQFPCPQLIWTTSLQQVKFVPNPTLKGIPFTNLTTEPTTPIPQIGWVKADAQNYCGAFTCELPAKHPVKIDNTTCLLPCQFVKPNPQPYPLSSGMPGIESWVICQGATDPSPVRCPLGAVWSSNAGTVKDITPPAPNDIIKISNTTVTNLGGTFIGFNYTFLGVACSCQVPLKPVLPDYKPYVKPYNSIVKMGSTVDIYVATQNIGQVAAVNWTKTVVELPVGNAQPAIDVGPLGAGETSKPETKYTYRCNQAGIFQFTVDVNFFRELAQAEADYTNNKEAFKINCGNVLACEDYV